MAVDFSKAFDPRTMMTKHTHLNGYDPNPHEPYR